MLEFFKSCELDMIDPSMETLHASILDGDDDLRLLDTEFAGPFLVQFWFNFLFAMRAEKFCSKEQLIMK